MAVIRHVLLRKLLRDLWDRRGSLLALVAIVTVGVACLAAMAAVYRDLDGARRRYYADRRLADFEVKLKRGPEWIIDEVALFGAALSEDDVNRIMDDGLLAALAVSSVGKLATTWGAMKSR